MLTKFAAALVATSLIASSAFATQSSGNSGSMPAAHTSQTENPSKSATRHKAVNVAKHRSTHVHKHFASGKNHGKSRMERHGGIRRWQKHIRLASPKRRSTLKEQDPIACDPE
jgi:hypothetical protein